MKTKELARFFSFFSCDDDENDNYGVVSEGGEMGGDVVVANMENETENETISAPVVAI